MNGVKDYTHVDTGRTTVNNEPIYKVKVKDFYHDDIRMYHRVTGLKTFGTHEMRYAIGDDIKNRRQDVPIALWRKKGVTHVIDGRNRLSGCKLHDIGEIDAYYLPTNSTIADLEAVVLGTRLRANTSSQQLAIEAYRLIDTEGSANKAAKRIGCSHKDVEAIVKISKYRPNLINIIYNSEIQPYKYEKTDGKVTSSLRAIAKAVEEEDTNAELALSVYQDTNKDSEERKASKEFKMAISIIEAALTAAEVATSEDTVDKVLYVLKSKRDSIRMDNEAKEDEQ